MEWGRRSGSNIRHLNIVPCLVFFHKAVFKNITINFISIHKSNHPLGTKKPEQQALCQCTDPAACGRGGCVMSMSSMRFQGILCEIPRSKLRQSISHLGSCRTGGTRKRANTIKINFSFYFLPSSNTVKCGI